MRIAVTGARGRVGRAVVDAALRDGHSVVGIDRPEATADRAHPRLDDVDADVTSYDDFEHAVQDSAALIHLAAYASPNGHPDHEVHNNNVVGSYNALSVAARLGIAKVCLASSINAIGGYYSRNPRYDYFPVDELHPTYNEDPYSLSKRICEEQADSFARRYESMTISTLRFHAVVPARGAATRTRQFEGESKQLWGYTTLDAAARACLLAVSADFTGHETFYVVAPRTTSETPSLALAGEYFPEVPIVGDLSGTRGFFDCRKAEVMLGWAHDPSVTAR
ncbi:MAG TPA: NAD(P)-dependent oxidoreductase [Mycobacteriales bacterium]|jgi:UDP-glucose 4-epimerase